MVKVRRHAIAPGLILEPRSYDRWTEEIVQPSRASSGKERYGEDWPRLLSFGTLVAAAFGVILLGAVLRTEQRRDDRVDLAGARPAPEMSHLGRGIVC